MENVFDWLSIFVLLLPILIFLGLFAIWEIRFVISSDDFTLWMPISGLFLLVPFMIDIYKLFTAGDLGFIFGTSAILLLSAYLTMLRIFSFKLLDWDKAYLFEPAGYGNNCLFGYITEGKHKFKAVLDEVYYPENGRGKLYTVKIESIFIFDFFPIRLKMII